MNLSEIVIKVIGLVLAVVGLALLLAAVGVNFLGIHITSPLWVEVLIGVVFLAAGIYIIRGGSINL